MHFIHEIIWIEWFLHNLLQFFKKFKFLEFPPIECVFRPIKNPLIFNHCSLPNSIGIHSMLDQSKLKNFQFLSFWPIFFCMHHLCLGFTCIALFFFFFFLYIHLAVLQSYLSLFSQITCIHFAKLGTQLYLKIYWLIFEFCTF